MPRREAFCSYWLLFEEEKGRVHVFRHKENAARVVEERGWRWLGETNKSEYLFPFGWSLDRVAEDA